MPSIPLPFVIAIVLGLFLIRALRKAESKLGLFPVLIGVFAFQAIISGLHWNMGWQFARLVQPIVAALLPGLCFVAFAQLGRERQTLAASFPHLVPAVFTAILVAFWRSPIDIVLFALYFGYGVALLMFAAQGPNALSAVRVTQEWTAYGAIMGMASVLVVTSFVDAIASFYFTLGNSEQGLTVLTIASVLWLVFAGYVVTIADDTKPGPDSISEDFSSARKGTRATESFPDDEAVVMLIDQLMQQKHFYRDPDLTLERLARRSGIPARQISGSLNRVHGQNISQVVNQYRVGDAKQRLASTTDPITVIMLESGFGTKSNFNREFRRVTGMTPSAYRRNGHEMTGKPDSRSK